MKFIAKSLQDTKKLAKAFYNSLTKDGLFVTLTGDIGAGKTQFVRYVLGYMNVKEKVTSPSFVILNEYKSDLVPIYHFDLYRLEEKGLKSITEELRQYSKSGVLTFIEWADFAYNEIPPDSLKINVQYNNDDIDIREFEFIDTKNSNTDFLNKLEKELSTL
jgi:tRNA threonylcarbamoyladenosine biosynthesis protein TsaE